MNELLDVTGAAHGAREIEHSFKVIVSVIWPEKLGSHQAGQLSAIWYCTAMRAYGAKGRTRAQK